jgi:hypothetical protein
VLAQASAEARDEPLWRRSDPQEADPLDLLRMNTAGPEKPQRCGSDTYAKLPPLHSITSSASASRLASHFADGLTLTVQLRFDALLFAIASVMTY